MIVTARTHIGNVRASNQDALLVLEGPCGLFGVADGMGGHQAGDVASRMAVEELTATLGGKKPSEKLLRQAIQEANRRIFDAQMQDEALSGMGTTLTMIWEDKKRVLLGHVGDSRAYCLRDGVLKQVSQDHSLVAQMVRDGLLTQEEAARHPYRNIITRALGTDETVEADILELDKRSGDLYLICSDGLTEYVSDPALQEILSGASMEEAADTLLRLALDGGGRDNVSLVLAEVTP
ncbi:MAG: Stp1/IreP family PP2C-type Ser/Thr phosphatase [Clostridia bacterium]|nr:Stp1/IreP family PP2C-type Ser/Thr phosphatase [Clostridia bacterium]